MRCLEISLISYKYNIHKQQSFKISSKTTWAKLCVLPSAGSGFIRCLHCRNPKLCLCSVTATKGPVPALVLWFPPRPTAWEDGSGLSVGCEQGLGPSHKSPVPLEPRCVAPGRDAGKPTGLKEHIWVRVRRPHQLSHKCKHLQWSCTHWSAANGDQCSQNHLPASNSKGLNWTKSPLE